MSLSTMTSLAFAQQQIANAASAARSGPSPSALRSAMEKIVAFIPSEVVALYVAGFGIISPEGDGGKWALFGVGCALVPIFIIINNLLKKRQAGPSAQPVKAWRIVVLSLLALLAFVAWAMALPGTPFLALTDAANRVGGFAVVVLAAVLYPFAKLIGVSE